MPKEYLGEFEELVLTLVAALQEDAYGAAITDEIESRLKREVNLSAVHVTLYRLQDKGLIKSSLGGATGERGGRRKRRSRFTSWKITTASAARAGPVPTGARMTWCALAATSICTGNSTALSGRRCSKAASSRRRPS